MSRDDSYLTRTLKEKRIIHAVHERDLDDFLKNLGLLDSLVKKELKCSICGTVVSRENLRFIYPVGDSIGLCCDKPDCYDQIVAVRTKKSE